MSETTDALSIARNLILQPSGLDNSRLDRVFGEVLTHSVDFADLYFQLSHEEAWSLEDGIVKDGSASIEQGVGVRALSGEKLPLPEAATPTSTTSRPTRTCSTNTWRATLHRAGARRRRLSGIRHRRGTQ